MPRKEGKKRGGGEWERREGGKKRKEERQVYSKTKQNKNPSDRKSQGRMFPEQRNISTLSSKGANRANTIADLSH